MSKVRCGGCGGRKMSDEFRESKLGGMKIEEGGLQISTLRGQLIVGDCCMISAVS